MYGGDPLLTCLAGLEQQVLSLEDAADALLVTEEALHYLGGFIRGVCLEHDADCLVLLAPLTARAFGLPGILVTWRLRALYACAGRGGSSVLADFFDVGTREGRAWARDAWPSRTLEKTLNLFDKTRDQTTWF